jgi:hypothetical protein
MLSRRAQRLSNSKFQIFPQKKLNRLLKSHQVYLVEICKLSIDHLVAASLPEQHDQSVSKYPSNTRSRLAKQRTVDTPIAIKISTPKQQPTEKLTRREKSLVLLAPVATSFPSKNIPARPPLVLSLKQDISRSSFHDTWYLTRTI